MGRTRQIEVNTWVTVQQQGRAQKLASATPALVSAVDHEAKTVTVIYPCELVLRMGFNGPPLKRLADVAMARVKLMPVGKSSDSLSKIQALLMEAVRKTAAAAHKSRAAQFDTNAESAQEQHTTAKPGSTGESAPATKNMRDEDTMSMTKASTPSQVAAAPSTPEPRTVTILDDASRDKLPLGGPAHDGMWTRARSRSRSLRRKVSDNLTDKRQLLKEEAKPPTSDAASKPMVHTAGRSAAEPAAPSPCQAKKRQSPATASNELKFLTCRAAARAFGRSEQLPCEQLVAALQGVVKESGESVQPEWLVQQLELWNKVFVADGLVFAL